MQKIIFYVNNFIRSIFTKAIRYHTFKKIKSYKERLEDIEHFDLWKDKHKNKIIKAMDDLFKSIIHV